ncbi:MAG: hypothetical protein HY812_15840 [Planctomycetes bacterium]|nr:hypothetical protein [Planctomycetota bacterium]
MKVNVAQTMVLCLLFTGIGLACGMCAGHDHGSAAPSAEDDHADDAHHELAPETLRNMGVEIAPAQLSAFTRCTEIPAVIEALPGARRDVHAPVAGRIRSIAVEALQVAPAGEALLALVRDPLPRAELTLTQDVLEPARESLHETMISYRRAAVALEVLAAERRRIEEVSGGAAEPVIPAERLIKLRYEEQTAAQEVASLQHELERHGLSAAQIAGLEKGEFPSVDVALWRKALENNGFWTAEAQHIHAALPPGLQALPWTVATIGELVAGGFAGLELVEWLEGDADAQSHFLEIGGLLQRGHSLADVRSRVLLGAFHDVVDVRAPAQEADFDVAALLVRPGEHVAAGQPLVRLDDPRRMHLRAEPAGTEIELVLAALAAGVKMTARPLVQGTAPPLTGVTLLKVDYEETGRIVACAAVENESLAARADSAGRTFRTWKLGAGQRYLLAVPRTVLEQVYVLPAAAITDDGPDRVVFRKHGEEFEKVRVQVLYEDHEVVVLPGDAALAPGEEIVTRGAFALGLALAGAGAEGDSGDEHGHAH